MSNQRYEIHNTDRHPSIKLVICGGTDDPAIEIHMSVDSKQDPKPCNVWPPINTMLIRFSALPHCTHEDRMMRPARDPIDFHPANQLNLSTLPSIQGLYNFSETLTGLKVAINSHKMATLQFESRGWVGVAIRRGLPIHNPVWNIQHIPVFEMMAHPMQDPWGYLATFNINV